MATITSTTLTDTSYGTRLSQWIKIREAIEGEDAVKQQGELYLPKPSGLTPKQYEAYKTRAYFFPATERTLRGMVGLAMRNDPIINVPDKLEPMIAATTSDATPINVMIDEIIREVLSLGRYGMLLDFPEFATVADVPYITTYMAEDIVNWEQEIVAGRKALTMVFLKDEVEVDETTGDETTCYIECALVDGVYTVSRWKDAKEGMIKIDEVVPRVKGKSLGYIPFVFVNPYDNRPTVEKPPFLDLVNVNMAHYRNSADYEHALFYTAQPTPWYSGTVTDEMRPRTIGPSTIWALGPDGKAGMLEFSGAGISAQRQAMEDKEGNMAALGARMIAEFMNRNESTDTARMRGRSETSLMLSVVNMAEHALNRLFYWAADWTGADPSKVDIKLNKDFYDSRMAAGDLSELVKAWQAGAISRTTLHENLQRGEIVDGKRTIEEEVDEIMTDEVNLLDAPDPLDVAEPDEIDNPMNDSITPEIEED